MTEAFHTEGPWEYVKGNEYHGPYVSSPWGGDICDCYTMSHPNSLSHGNGGISKPVLHQGVTSEANAQLIAAAPDLKAVAEGFRIAVDDDGALWLILSSQSGGNEVAFCIGRRSGIATQAASEFEKLRNAALKKARGEQ